MNVNVTHLAAAIASERESYTAIIDDLSQKNKDLTWTCERLIHALEVAERKLEVLKRAAQPCVRATATYEERERLQDALDERQILYGPDVDDPSKPPFGIIV